MKFENHTLIPKLFFKMLPRDWQELIVPFWDEIKSTSQLYVLIEENCVLAGGLVFSKCPPDMKYYKKADEWFKKGYLYLGFIFVDETKRNRNLGSLWLENVKKEYPKNGFWLAIEDENLHKFYIRNGFEKVETVKNEELNEESIYIYNP